MSQWRLNMIKSTYTLAGILTGLKGLDTLLLLEGLLDLHTTATSPFRPHSSVFMPDTYNTNLNGGSGFTHFILAA